MVDLAAARLDHPTLAHAVLLLEARLQAVVTYGAGGCSACHDAELRGAISLLKRLMAPRADEQPAEARAAAVRPSRRR